MLDAPKGVQNTQICRPCWLRERIVRPAVDALVLTSAPAFLTMTELRTEQIATPAAALAAAAGVASTCVRAAGSSAGRV